MMQRSFRRSTISAKAPAGRVKRKNGREATVEIRDSKNVEEPSMFIVQVAAVSCAATHVPESKMANQSFRYTGFCNAAKVEVLLRRTFISVRGLRCSNSKTRNTFYPSRQVWIAGRAVPGWREGATIKVLGYKLDHHRFDQVVDSFLT